MIARTLRALGRHSFPRFCLVGALGFAVDAGILVALLSGTGLDPFQARLLSLLTALTVTWILNRHLAFRSRDRRRLFEWSRYLLVNGVGAALNYACYAGCLLLTPAMPPMLALAVGSAVALAANYAGARLFVFTHRSVSDLG